MKVTFTIQGKPIGKHRHRSTVLPNGIIHNYNDKTNTNYEKLVAREYKAQCNGIYFVGELEVVIIAYFGIPKSWSKKKKEQALDGEIRPQSKPDVDNISKIILDSLNKIAFEDDKDVVDLTIHKWYAEEPRVEVTIIGEYAKV